MISIEKSRPPNLPLTVFSVKAPVRAEDIIRELRDFYAAEPTELVLWLFPQGTTPSLFTADIQEIAQALLTLANQARPKGKSAIVGFRELEYGLARMFEAYIEAENVPYSYRVFRTEVEAMAWLSR